MSDKIYRYNLDFEGTADNTASSKAKEDANAIFIKKGYKNLITNNFYIKNIIIRKIINILLGIVAIIRIKRGGYVTVNFPFNTAEKKVIFGFLYKIKKIKNIKIIVLIHDLESLRKNKIDSIDNNKEIDFLVKTDIIIAHNRRMIDWLVSKGISESKIVDLEIFDYLGNFLPSGGDYDGNIIIAGNLDFKKVKYLLQIEKIKNVKFNLYGPNISQDMLERGNANYFGSFSPDEVPEVIKGMFGLVWDSDSLKGGDGIFGEYQRYNNPHKASLYLASEFPIIMWSDAALASFIDKNNLGFVVDSLKQLPEKIDSISESDYMQMKKNTQQFGEKIRSGYFLSEALKKAENILEENK